METTTMTVSRIRVTDAERQVRRARNLMESATTPERTLAAVTAMRKAWAEVEAALLACPDHTAPVGR